MFFMIENPAASDWSAARGEKWRSQAAGMEAMLAPVDEPLIDALNLDAPCRIADIGCGGGATTWEMLRRAPLGSVVHGFDISSALIELARNRESSDGRAIAFELADVATTAPSGAAYDRLVSRFGVMFFDDPPAAFRNLLQWLAPRGHFAFAVWGRPSENPWMAHVRDVLAKIIDLPKPEPERPWPVPLWRGRHSAHFAQASWLQRAFCERLARDAPGRRRNASRGGRQFRARILFILRRVARRSWRPCPE